MGETLRQYCHRTGLSFLLSQWLTEENLPLTPDNVTYASHRRVWWRCEAGHTWQVSPDARKTGTACPYCAGVRPVVGVNDLTTAAPALASQWHPSRNGVLRPEDVTPGSRRAVWWQCAEGHTWRASPQAVRTGGGCPACRAALRRSQPRPKGERKGTLAECFPLLALQWSPRNGDLTPDKVSTGSHRKVWWRCGQGHEWQAAVYSRTGKLSTGCPACAAARREKSRGDTKMVSSA